jgi:probable HAF family extracellular repeat protein
MIARPKILLSLAALALGAPLTALAQDIPLTIFDAPGATGDSYTAASGVNDAGVIVGFEDSTGSPLGFVRATDGTFTSLTVPGAGFTILGDISNNGQMTGQFGPAGFAMRHAFITDGTSFTYFDVPGASKTAGGAINDSGATVGVYWDATNMVHGFLRSASGSFTLFDVPGAVATRASGINDSGQVVGTYQTSDLNYHGFLRSLDGSIFSFDAPGAALTFANGLNESGVITGGTDGSGYVRQTDGSYRFFDTPDGDYNPSGTGINNLGLVVGTIDDDFTTHSFYATVPEPSSLVLWAFGMGLVVKRRRR